ncbi:MAG: Unknown protein [uncultured Campylobacterales bacterium]|uniref:Nitrogen regulatory protein P-II n=1 Tax=uncultured Campylobacterales bacterium TaxID=352960 RepID=A0A6S6S5P0_9BACT|nr:MAG: Unknown protein [uncultured Campylobacterales bacterium]
MKKIELIIESLYLSRLIKIFDKNDINGYTIIKDIEGMGERGFKSADEITDVFKNYYIFTVCEEPKAKIILEGIKKFMRKYGGKCIVSDVEWLSIHE